MVTLLAICLLGIGAGPAVVAQSPPPYPEDAGITFEPVGPSAWRVLEPDLDCEREPLFGTGDTAASPDGRVWLLTTRGRTPNATRHLYVITPEAVADVE